MALLHKRMKTRLVYLNRLRRQQGLISKSSEHQSFLFKYYSQDFLHSSLILETQSKLCTYRLNTIVSMQERKSFQQFTTV